MQLRRADVGTVLIDPRELPDLAALGAAIGSDEWVLHAASQDLPCLAELGLRPERVFDTELAGRLLGYARVGLGAIVEEVLGLSLEKGHSAADWSTRPLPEPWLRYAALDVEVLVELRDVLAAQLDEQGKREWAEQEFAAIVAARRRRRHGSTPGGAPPACTGCASAASSPWCARCGSAATRWPAARDIAPGRVLPDSAIVAAALAAPRTEEDLVALPGLGRAARCAGRPRPWLPAIAAALALPDDRAARASRRRTRDRHRPASWGDRDPAAAARLAAARAAVGSRRRRAPAAGREPALAGHRPPAGLGPAAGRRRRGRGRLPAGARRPRLAGRADRRRAGHRAGRTGRGPVLTALSR